MQIFVKTLTGKTTLDAQALARKRIFILFLAVILINVVPFTSASSGFHHHDGGSSGDLRPGEEERAPCQGARGNDDCPDGEYGTSGDADAVADEAQGHDDSAMQSFDGLALPAAKITGGALSALSTDSAVEEDEERAAVGGFVQETAVTTSTECMRSEDAELQYALHMKNFPPLLVVVWVVLRKETQKITLSFRLAEGIDNSCLGDLHNMIDDASKQGVRLELHYQQSYFKDMTQQTAIYLAVLVGELLSKPHATHLPFEAQGHSGTATPEGYDEFAERVAKLKYPGYAVVFKQKHQALFDQLRAPFADATSTGCLNSTDLRLRYEVSVLWKQLAEHEVWVVSGDQEHKKTLRLILKQDAGVFMCPDLLWQMISDATSKYAKLVLHYKTEDFDNTKYNQSTGVHLSILVGKLLASAVDDYSPLEPKGHTGIKVTEGYDEFAKRVYSFLPKNEQVSDLANAFKESSTAGFNKLKMRFVNLNVE